MDIKLQRNVRNGNTIAKNILTSKLQAKYSALQKPVVGWAYLINSHKVLHEGLSHNGQYYVFRYLDQSLEHKKPVLLKVCDATDFSKYIITPENSIL